MMQRLLLAAVVLLACAGAAAAQVQDLGLMEVGSASTISSAAARPLQDVARLLVEANRNMARLAHTRQPYNVVANHIRVRKQATLALRGNGAGANGAPAPTVNAQLLPNMYQPRVHDAERFGTKHPIDQTRAGWVDAAIVGEDGKPYLPRKQFGVEDEPESFMSPFAKFIHPPSVGSSADVKTTDPNTKLTPLETKNINAIQLRLKDLLDQLGANIVWDHTSIKNRRVMSEFAALKEEARALMEEYELRTGVKTIAWQLGDADARGLEAPTGGVTDIHFSKNPELAGRVLQRAGDRKGPPPPTASMIAAHRAETGPLKPKEQTVSVGFKKQADGVVKAKVVLNVVDSKMPLVDQPPNQAARKPVAGVKYPSGKVGSPSLPVQIDVVAPADETLVRNRDMGASAEDAAELAAHTHHALVEVEVDHAPAINL